MTAKTSTVDTAPAYTGEAPRVISPGPGPIAVPRLGIWELAWPAIANNILHSLVGLVGIKIVGTLGASAVAAVTVGNRIFFVLQALLMAITAGTSWRTAPTISPTRPGYCSSAEPPMCRLTTFAAGILWTCLRR